VARLAVASAKSEGSHLRIVSRAVLGVAAAGISVIPAVVAAGPDGLEARHAGVATVTATVTYEGGSATGAFVMSVY